MATVNEKQAESLRLFGRNLIPEDIIYLPDNDDSYGYENEPHVTVKFGYSPDLSKAQIASILEDVKNPFYVTLTEISMFKNELFDVIKFTVSSPELIALRKKADQYPNQDAFPTYNPHMTIAYVKPNSFNRDISQKFAISVLISHFTYSGQDGKITKIKLY